MNINRAHVDSNVMKAAQEAVESRKKDAFSEKRAAETQVKDGPISEDTVVISEEARTKADDFQSKLDAMRDEMRALREDLKRAQEAGEGAAEAWKEKIRCLQIAMRIMSGNKVPIEDHRYLAEKDAELYNRAIQLRVEKEDPKEYDRLSEDEEDNADAAVDGAPEAAPAAADAQSGDAEAPAVDS